MTARDLTNASETDAVREEPLCPRTSAGENIVAAIGDGKVERPLTEAAQIGRGSALRVTA
jgi:hypothetical protein